jgi:CopA family copper-resistance protein
LKSNSISRRSLLKGMGALGMLKGLESILPSYVWASIPNTAIQTPELSGDVIGLTIAETPFRIDNLNATATTINGSVPGPLIRLQEGQNITLKVTNHLKEASSIHWHGILLPPDMDGVPGVSFAGIDPGTTFEYQFPIKQSGTYWYHSHSKGQEQSGVYAPMIIDPIEPDPIRYDREYIVMLSDWSFESVEKMIAKLKKHSDYFNYQRRTLGEFFLDLKQNGWSATFEDYMAWARMRMDPTDLGDVTSHVYTYLMNGLSPATNWTGLFNPGERVRLRFIQVGTMTFQDVRIPGLKMTVVQADGQNVQPIEVDEFRIGPAETYDVIVEPKEERAYTIFAETLDRSGYTRGTLAPHPGMSAAIPKRRPRPLRTMDDMGMDMSDMHMNGMKIDSPKIPDNEHHMSGMHDHLHLPGQIRQSKIPGSTPVKHGPDDHGPGNQMVPDFTRSRLDEPGIGLGNDGRRVLVYSDLKSLYSHPDQRKPGRELEIHLTGNMERYMWSFNGKKYSDTKKPIHFKYGERLRWTFVNDTMMEHTMHLHGMWMHLENGAGKYLPRKHTVLVKPAERVSVAITADALGQWAFHCHLLLHMDVGMFRIVKVSDAVQHAQL